MGPREGRPRPAGGPGYSPGAARLRGRRSWSQGHPQDTRSPASPHASPPPPRPQLLSPPQPRHPLTGRGSFPEPAAGSGPSAGYLLQRRDPGQGAGEGDSPRARRTVPGEEGGRRRLSAPSLLTALPLLRAGASPPAATTAEERGGACPGPGARALTCRRGNTGQLPDGTAQWGADRGEGRASHASGETTVLRGPAFPAHPRGSSSATTKHPRPVPALVESEYGEGRGPLLWGGGRPREPCSKPLRAAPAAHERSWFAELATEDPLSPGAADNNVLEKWFQHRIFP